MRWDTEEDQLKRESSGKLGWNEAEETAAVQGQPSQAALNACFSVTLTSVPWSSTMLIRLTRGQGNGGRKRSIHVPKSHREQVAGRLTSEPSFLTTVDCLNKWENSLSVPLRQGEKGSPMPLGSHGVVTSAHLELCWLCESNWSFPSRDSPRSCSVSSKNCLLGKETAPGTVDVVPHVRLLLSS